MAGTKTGTFSVVQHAHKITTLVQKYGVTDLEARTNTAFYDCVIALAQCFVALAATDDYLLQRDTSAPLGPEDVGGP
jgi:hypothetical protein